MSSRSASFFCVLAGAALLTLLGCGEDEETEVLCPSGSTLTYQNFGQSFVETYCLSCHNEALTGSARQDAPADVNFNTVAQIRAESEEIDERAGASTSVTHEDMPRGNGPKPSVEERRKLSEWLSCGAP